MRYLTLCAAAVIAAGLLGWLPASEKDVGDLLPVQTLVVGREDGLVTLDGGEKLSGRGESWAAAMDDLRATAPGEAFFGTAEQIVLTDGARDVLMDMLADRSLRPAARVYAGTGPVEAGEATAFLEAHKGEITVQDLQAAALEGRTVTLPRLVCEDGRYRLDAG